MKTTAILFAFFCLFAVTFADDTENLQQFYNGIFNQGGLANPTTVLSCYDATSATLTMNSIGTLLQQIAVKNFFGAIKTMKLYYHQAPQSINTCLQHNDEFIALYHAYGQNFTCLQMLARASQYSLVHANELVKLDSIANDDFIAGNYTGAGQQLGVIAQQAISVGAAEEVFEQLVQNFLELEQVAETAFPLSFKRPSQRSFRAGF